MNFEPEKLYSDFITSFQNNILKSKQNNELPELSNHRETTNYYKTDLLVKVASDLNLVLSEKEYLRVDYTLSKRGKTGSFYVPFVVIESENDSVGDLQNEIHKLLSLNAPLKILLTRYNSLQNEINSVSNNHEDTDWYYVLQDFIEFDRLDGIFAVISLEKDDNGSHQFSYISYDKNGIFSSINKF